MPSNTEYAAPGQTPEATGSQRPVQATRPVGYGNVPPTIAMRNVTLVYPAQPDKPALDNVSLDIMPQGSATAAYQVKYSDVRATKAGNIAHNINANATIEKKKMSFSLTYKNIDWNGNVKIDRSIPNGYSRMSASSLSSIFAN